MNPLVSIIITTYNRSSLLGETLSSIILQDYRAWECIVIDDGSLDYTPELMEFYIQKDSRIKYYSRPSNIKKGATACRNFGFSLSKGEYINWFDSDDIMHPEYLKKQTNVLAESSYQFAVCNFSVFKTRPEEHYFTVSNQSTNKNVLEDYISGKINLGVQCTMWKRNIVSNYFFDEDLFWAQELDFIFRILKDNELNVAFVNENLIFLRRHDNSMTGNFQRFNIDEISSELKIRRDILNYLYFTNKNRELFTKALDLYFLGFKMLFLSKGWKEINLELKELNDVFSLKMIYTAWKLKLYVLYILHRLKFKRTNLHKHFQKFQSLISKNPVIIISANES